jgi:hypothetical protein
MRSGVRRRWSDAATALAAGTVAAVCAWAASSGTVGALERAVFSFVNGWPDVLRWPLWIFQTLGVLGMPLIVAAAALLLRRWRLAVALVLLVPLKLLVEKDVLKALVQRERPGTTIPGAILRDVPCSSRRTCVGAGRCSCSSSRSSTRSLASISAGTPRWTSSEAPPQVSSSVRCSTSHSASLRGQPRVPERIHRHLRWMPMGSASRVLSRWPPLRRNGLLSTRTRHDSRSQDARNHR